MPDIGKRIREKREARGITQEQLAEKLGYKNKSSIAKIETGTNDITQSKVVAFAKALDTSVAYLMGWEEDIDAQDSLSREDEQDIAKKLESMMKELTENKHVTLYFDGKEIDDTSAEFLASALESALRQVKIINKGKSVSTKNKEKKA